MLRKLKNNLTSITKLSLTKDEKLFKTFLYLIFLALLLAFVPLLNSYKVTENGLNYAQKNEIENLLKPFVQSEANCEINEKLTCDEEVYIEVTAGNFLIILDSANDFENRKNPSNQALVFQETAVGLYQGKAKMLNTTYAATDSYWSSTLNGLKIEDTDDFWNDVYSLINQTLSNYAILIMVMSFLVYMFSFITILMMQILINVVILMVLRASKLKFGETFKIVVNAMTIYAIIVVILELYFAKYDPMVNYFINLVALIYALSAVKKQSVRERDVQS